MTTFYYTHPSFLTHDTGLGHPENALRLRAIDTVLNRSEFASLVKKEAPRAEIGQILRVHTKAHADNVFASIPEYGIHYLALTRQSRPVRGKQPSMPWARSAQRWTRCLRGRH